MNLLRWCQASLVLAHLAVLPLSAQDQFFDADGVRIRYVEAGSGEAVVLLHGLGGNLATWTNVGLWQELSRNYHVIAFDLRGHGQSGKPHDDTAYGAEMALDVVRLLDHLKIEKAHVVGYSLGGILTSKLLTLHADRFLTATLIAGAARLEWTAEAERFARLEGDETERDCISRSLARRLAPPDHPPSEEDLRAQAAACIADPSYDRVAQASIVRSRRDQATTREAAAAVEVPTLGIFPGESHGSVAQSALVRAVRFAFRP